MKIVLFATSNKNKVQEANEVGKKFKVKFRQIKLPYPEVRSESVVEVAKEGIKHVQDKLKTKKPVIVEDAGLFINALNGFPGTYSATVYSKIGNKGILKLMRGIKDRSAYFASAVGYFDPKTRKLRIFEGRVDGVLCHKERGSLGFGYDPLFIPDGCRKTFAEDFDSKSVVSHRRRAFEKLCRWLERKTKRCC